MTDRIFLDTNVVYDFLLVRHPFFESALLLINSVKKRQKTLRLSSLSVANIKYFAVKIHGSKTARKGIEFLLKHFEVTTVDSEVIKNSHQANWKDLEDAIQYYSALSAKADMIVTRDVADYEERKIRILTPAEALERIERG